MGRSTSSTASHKVRLERDHPAEIRDRYNRYLAYVFVEKDGKWVNYNVEAVRAGMSPYFPKYGNSRRFHDEFVEGRRTRRRPRKRGIWAPGVQAYPDYAERVAWWTARGSFVDEFRDEGEGKPNYIDITHWDATKQLEDARRQRGPRARRRSATCGSAEGARRA